jgi:hypothetical protein
MTPERTEQRWVEKHYDDKFRVTEKDIEKLYKSSEKSLPRSEYDAHHKILELQIDELRIAKSKLDGMASRNQVYISYAISVGLIILEVIKLFK